MAVVLRSTDEVDSARVYGSYGYGRAVAESCGAEWVVAVEKGWRLPLSISGPPHAREAATPYGYAGIEISSEIDDTTAAEYWRQTCLALAERGIVTAFIRFPPFVPRQAERAALLPRLEVRQVSETVLVPTRSEEDAWAAMQGRARTAVRKARNQGMTATVEVADDRLADEHNNFRRLYDSTMSRLRAPAHLRFESSYYRQIVASLGDRLRVATVWDQGTAVASCLLLGDEDTLHYHLSGSDPHAAKQGANNLMIWAAMLYAAEAGHDAMHLGGGTSEGDSLFRFKSSFGGSALPFHTGRAVIDSAKYDMLVNQRAVQLGVPGDALRNADFFPGFRATAPLPSDAAVSN